MSIAILVLTVVLVPAAWNFRNSYKKINELIDRFYGDIGPLVRNANTIADNVNYITTAIRVDVQQFNQTVALANRAADDGREDRGASAQRARCAHASGAAGGGGRVRVDGIDAAGCAGWRNDAS